MPFDPLTAGSTADLALGEMTPKTWRTTTQKSRNFCSCSAVRVPGRPGAVDKSITSSDELIPKVVVCDGTVGGEAFLMAMECCVGLVFVESERVRREALERKAIVTPTVQRLIAACR